jgi:hypothetical protein
VARREAYPNPQRPTWPPAEFIVGNPPFLGKGVFMREAFGDAYVRALWKAHPHMNESADFVMYWWDRAAEFLAPKGSPLRQFGLVTTNSITQDFSRRVIKRRMEGANPLSIVFAIPDHPWTKATPDAAMVRIAMTVAVKGDVAGQLREVVGERDLDTDQPLIAFRTSVGKINSDLSIGADVSSTTELLANCGLANNGMLLAGRGFVLSEPEARRLGLAEIAQPSIIRPYLNGRDLMVPRKSPRYVIDLLNFDAEEARREFPAIYQHLLSRVKPERDKNNRASYRNRWWQFAEPRRDFRPALLGLHRYIATTETTKHRIFQFVDATVVPDHMIIAFAFVDAYVLGVLSSRIHVTWALRAGGWLGVGNDPRYSKSKVFDPFPFPSPGELLKAQIRSVAEELDAFRKARQQEHPSLTLTQMYNVLEKLNAIAAARRTPSPSLLAGEGARASGSEARAGEGSIHTAHNVDPSPGFAPDGAQPPSPTRGEGNGASSAAVRDSEPLELTPAEEEIKRKGLILNLKELHEKLDRLVFEAYGWPETLGDEQILERLVALNHERAAEERRGHVRWLRPDYQIPRFGKDIDKMAAKEEGAQLAAELGLPEPAARKPSFPGDPVAQTAAVFAVLAAARGPTDAGTIASRYRRSKTLERTISDVLDSLARLGHVTTRDGTTFEIRRVA